MRIVSFVDTAVAIFKTSETYCARAHGLLKARMRGVSGEWKNGKER